MKRATLPCHLEIYYEGEGGGFAMDDPLAVLLRLPDGHLVELIGDCGSEIKAELWVTGGWLYKAKIEVADD